MGTYRTIFLVTDWEHVRRLTPAALESLLEGDRDTALVSPYLRRFDEHGTLLPLRWNLAFWSGEFYEKRIRPQLGEDLEAADRLCMDLFWIGPACDAEPHCDLARDLQRGCGPLHMAVAPASIAHLQARLIAFLRRLSNLDVIVPDNERDACELAFFSGMRDWLQYLQAWLTMLDAAAEVGAGLLIAVE